MFEGGKSDCDLFRSFQNGSKKAFGELYSRYYKLAFRSAYLILSSKEDAEDAADDFFVSLLGNGGGFDPSRPFASYVYAGARNAAINVAKKRKASFEELDEEGVPGESEKRLSPSEGVMGFLRSVLSPEEVSVYVLHVAFSYSFREIGEMTSISGDSASSRFSRARAKIEKAPKPTISDD